MTIQDIQKAVDDIKEQGIQGADERAHSHEDKLREDFIKYIATFDDDNVAAMARLVLSTNDLEFARWCA